jgi:hypothetical protein
VNTTVLEETPPGFITVINAEPAAAKRLAGTTADNWVLLMKLVDRMVGVEPTLH